MVWKTQPAILSQIEKTQRESFFYFVTACDIDVKLLRKNKFIVCSKKSPPFGNHSFKDAPFSWYTHIMLFKSSYCKLTGASWKINISKSTYISLVWAYRRLRIKPCKSIKILDWLYTNQNRFKEVRMITKTSGIICNIIKPKRSGDWLYLVTQSLSWQQKKQFEM
jgi:hypothetical protein